MFENTKPFSTFSSNDIEACKKFYEETLGLSVGENMGGLSLNFSNGAQVFIYPKEDHEPAVFTVLNLPVPDVDAAVDELTSRGVTFEKYDLPDLKTDDKGVMRGEGPMIAWFKDPVGNIISIMNENFES
jgi:catechol 2,3-dioxygenase-like lactoylglutathione lyase family enzyme